MRLDRETEPDVEINITPLIDVVFLLLIFFMVSTTFTHLSQLQIQLPESSAEPHEEPPEAIEVAIDGQGRYYIGGHQLVNTERETLLRALRQAAKGRKDPPVVISGDRKAQFQAVVGAMDVARELGLVHLTFATAQTPETEGP